MSNVGAFLAKSSNNLFTADLTLAANRNHNLNNNTLRFFNEDSASIFLDTYSSASANKRVALVGRRARGTQASPEGVLANDLIYAVGGRAHDGTSFSGTSKASMSFFAGGNWSPTSHPTRIGFATTDVNSLTQTQRLTILPNGNIGVNTTNPTAKLEVQAVDGNGANKALTVRNHLNTGDLATFYNDGSFEVTKGISEGFFAGGFNGTGVGSTHLGYVAGFQSSVEDSVFIGRRAGLSNTGLNPTFIGAYAGNLNTGNNVVFAGFQAGLQNSGVNAVGMGLSSLNNNTGADVTAVGEATGVQNTGANNSYFGARAGLFLATSGLNTGASNSLYLGAFTLSKEANQTNEIVIGHGAIGEGSNKARIGNSSVTELHVGGNGAAVALKSPDGTTWRISVDNSGTLVIV